MKTLISFALAVCATAAMLAGCSSGGSGSPSPALGSAGSNASQRGAHTLGQRHDGFMGFVEGIAHPDHHKSWRSPELKKDINGRQLWISDTGTYDVYIYDLPSLTPVATLTGFSQPQGECSDSSGDVWITNTGYYSGNHVIYEYSHDGTLLNTLTDPTGLPVGCAWDKTTGNLAVTNIFNDGGSEPPGGILVYTGATGTPTVYQDPDPNIYAYFSAGYDGRGNLFFDVAPYSYTPAYIDKIPKGSSSVHRITVSGGTIYGPGAVQWIPAHGGGKLMVEDDDCSNSFSPITSCIDYITISHSAGTITSTAALNNSQGAAACSVSQVVRSGMKLYAGDYEDFGTAYVCANPSAGTTIDTWSYPSAGNPLKTSAILSSYNEPDGTAISAP